MIQLIWSCGIALPACWIAFAATWASIGALGGVHGDGEHVAGPAPAETDAMRVPTWTELLTDTTSRISRDISMMPNSTNAKTGVSSAASTATAPLCLSCFL